MPDPQNGNYYKYRNCQKSSGQPDGQTDRNIILPLRGLEPMTCGRMRQKAAWTNGQKDRETYKLYWTQLGCLGPHLGG